MRRLHSQTLGVFLAGLAVLVTADRLRAHEGHAAVPSTGVTMDGDELLISQAAIEAIEMETAVIQLGDLRQELHVRARVELPWSQQARVATLTSGKVERVLVKPGERVEVGQELARISALELEELQSELLETVAEIRLLERLQKQRESLAARGGIAGKVVLENEAKLHRKRAGRGVLLRKLTALGIDSSRLARVEATGQTVASVPVVSPIGGSVEHSHVQPGQRVESTDHLFDIVNLSKLHVIGEVLETDAHQVQPGLPVRITFPGPDEQVLQGRIARVRMKMNEAERTVEVVVPVEAQGLRLRPGMFGRMSIEVAAAEQEIVCPVSALIETEGESSVLRREGEGKFRRRPVEITMRDAQRAVVKGGLFPGQQVVTKGARLLAAMFETSEERERSAGNEQPGGHSHGEQVRDGKEDLASVNQLTSIEPNGQQQYVRAAKATVEVPTSQKALATSMIEGRVADIRVEEGQFVEAGEVLAQVESQELRNLELDLLQTAGQLQWMRGEVERLQPLAEAGNVPKQEFWQQELEAKRLSQRVSSLQRRLSMIGLPDETIQRLQSGELPGAEASSSPAGRLAVRAPISGRVAGNGSVLGQIVHSDDSLFEIQDVESVWVKALVLEEDASRMEVGQEASLTFPADPSRRIEGTLVRMGAQLVSRQRVLPVWIEVANTDNFLKDGMLARVMIRVPRISRPDA